MSPLVMRKYLDILNEANYEDLFKQFKTVDMAPNDVAALENLIATNIQWAKRTLKKNDRIIWYLRLVKIAVASYISLRTLVVNPRNAAIEEYNRKTKGTKLDKTISINLAMSGISVKINGETFQLQDVLTHYLGSNIPEIERHVWNWETPEELLTIFGNYERKWQEIRKGLIKYDPEDFTEIIRFGDGYSWIMLSRAYCKAEGDAMGHCGNVEGQHSPSQRILSLRKLIIRGKEKYWEPTLTFILHKDGKLGEMKGRANEKPARKYHPYIIKLLMNDIVNGIHGGGYLPKNNFSLDDLTKEEFNEIAKSKPSLLSIKDRYKLYGATDEVLNELESLFKGEVSSTITVDKNYVTLRSYDSLEDIIGEFGSKQAKYYLKVLEEPIEIDISPYDATLYMLQEFSLKESKQFYQYLTERYLQKIKKFEENDVANIRRDNSDMIMFLEENVPDLFETLSMAYRTGLETGTYLEIEKMLQKSVTNIEVEHGLGSGRDVGFKVLEVGLGYKIVIPIEYAINKSTDDEWFRYVDYELDDLYINVDEPRAGFEKFDGNLAREYLYNEFPELKSDENKRLA